MKTDVASDLARSVPQLDAAWQSAQHEVDLPYVALGELAGRIIELDQLDPRPDWMPLFVDVESRLGAADPITRELLIVGFLEDLQNITMNTGHDLARWGPLLGPLTREAWTALVGVWQGKMSPMRFNAFVARDIAEH
jgi:hypothetical protein